VWGLDIIFVDTPSGEVAEKSSSYDLSIFSSRADLKFAEAVPEGSSPSIRGLWPDIDKLDKIQCEDTSISHTCDVTISGRNVMASAEKADRRSRRSGYKASLSDAPRPSNIESKGRVSGSVRREVA
jgi:hypothetical protein